MPLRMSSKRQKRLFHFAGRSTDGKHIAAAKNLNAVGGLEGAQVLVMLTKKPERFVCPAEMNFFSNQDPLELNA